jgi:hypothetical protein
MVAPSIQSSMIDFDSQDSLKPSVTAQRRISSSMSSSSNERVTLPVVELKPTGPLGGGVGPVLFALVGGGMIGFADRSARSCVTVALTDKNYILFIPFFLIFKFYLILLASYKINILQILKNI